MKKNIVRYSDAFKIQVVSELESGKFKCIFEARKRYAIRGVGTVENWIRKYGKNHLLNSFSTLFGVFLRILRLRVSAKCEM